MKHRFSKHFWRLCIGSMLFYMAFNMVLPEMPDHLRSLGGQDYLGWIISIFALSALTARPISGWFADRYGRRLAILGGTALCVLGSSMYPVAGAVAFLLFARGFHGFFTGFAPTGFTAFVTDISPVERRGEAMGYQGLLSNIGTSVGMLISSILVIKLGREGMYFTSIGLGICAFLIFLTLPETRPENVVKKKLINHGLFYWRAWKPALITLLVAAPIGTLLIVMPDYTKYLGFQNKGIFLTIYVACSLLSRIFSGKISDRLGRPLSTCIGTFCQMLCMLLLVLVPGHAAFFTAAILFGIGQGFNAPSLFAWAADLSTEDKRGRAAGMVYIGLEGGVTLGGLIAGYIYSNVISNLKYLFMVDAGMACAALLLSLLFFFQNKKMKKGLI